MESQQMPLPWLERTVDEGAQSVTIACVSELTDEEGGIIVTAQTTIDDVIREYARQFPREAAAFLLKIKETTASLQNARGMSANRSMMSLTSIPEFVMYAMRARERTYWNTKKRIYDFIRRFPGFMIGDKTKKDTKGAIIH